MPTICSDKYDYLPHPNKSIKYLRGGTRAEALHYCRQQVRVGRARPRTAQNPAERLGDDEDDMDMEDDAGADVAGPSGLQSALTTTIALSTRSLKLRSGSFLNDN